MALGARGRAVAAAVAFVTVALVLKGAPARALQANPGPESGADPWLAEHVFIGEDGCLSVSANQHIAVGDSITVFIAGKAVRACAITSTLDGDSARAIFKSRGFDDVFRDRALWSRIGCAWGLAARSDPPAHLIARFAPEDTTFEAGGADPLGITRLPATAIVLGGDGRVFSHAELAAMIPSLAGEVPRAYLRGGALRYGREFHQSNLPGVLELLLGIPVWSKGHGPGSIRSIRIQRLYLSDGRILASEKFTRASGREEHVDLEPPQLDESNWFDVFEQPIGFLSLDGGATWDRISRDVGFEGITWRIARLGAGMPSVWDFYLYTYH